MPENIRVPMSKKMRFDVFKRDGFQCQYCGSTPPSVVLEVDHIHIQCQKAVRIGWIT